MLPMHHPQTRCVWEKRSSHPRRGPSFLLGEQPFRTVHKWGDNLPLCCVCVCVCLCLCLCLCLLLLVVKGAFWVPDVQELTTLDASETHARRLNAKEVLTQRKCFAQARCASFVVTVARPKRATPCRASHVTPLLVWRNAVETVDTATSGGMSSWPSGWPQRRRAITWHRRDLPPTLRRKL